MRALNRKYHNATGNLTPPPGYTQVAQEGETKTFNTPTNVAYGANGIFAYLNNVQGKVTFSPSTFGYDPVRNVVKGGFAQTALLLSDKALMPVSASPSTTQDPNPSLSPNSSNVTVVPAGASTTTTKYLLIGGIGIVVIIGGIFLYKKLKKKKI
jgi:hypothetical protein